MVGNGETGDTIRDKTSICVQYLEDERPKDPIYLYYGCHQLTRNKVLYMTVRKEKKKSKFRGIIFLKLLNIEYLIVKRY